jgi:hypothetical protein
MRYDSEFQLNEAMVRRTHRPLPKSSGPRTFRLFL